MSASSQRAPMTAPLRRLANLYGVQTAYYDFSRKRTEASADVVVETLRQLGAPVRSGADAPGAVRARTQELWARVIEPVVVVHPAPDSTVDIRLPAGRARGQVRCSLRLEDGTEKEWVCELRRTANTRSHIVEGVAHVGQQVPLPIGLPVGYHELTIEGSGELHRSRLIAAPLRAFASPDRQWGVFMPLYSLYSLESWGAGDFSDLGRLQEWVGGLGGTFVAILPVLAAFDQRPFDPSPYAPSSRLFWNEFYVDPRRAPELAECPRAQQLLASRSFQQEMEACRAAPEVDYHRQRALRRGLLDELARGLAGARNERYGDLQRYIAAHPSLEAYAAFAAVLERRQAPWPEWPEPLRSGVIGPQDRDPEAFFYHLYVQWLAEQQLAAVANNDGRKPGLHLDLPLGVHAHGYDTWRYRDAFSLEACGGAPPDSVFTRGQNWQFPPLHPEGIRAQGYSYLVECLRHQLAHASSLRIDHVMGLHRLYWIPKGWPASEGVYVRYRAEELYAILCLESHRHRATLAGENLGTVPTYVNAALSRHGIHKMYVIQYEAQPDLVRPLRPVPADSAASVNTHDMLPFAAYSKGMDLEDRVTLGLLPKSRFRPEQQLRRRIRTALTRFFRQNGCLPSRPDQDAALIEATLTWLARSAASEVLINLEDLWMETEPQNLPGTALERPNWRRKARYPLDQFTTHTSVIQMMRVVADARERARGRR